MSLEAKLTTIKSALAGLLEVANNKTGASDESIGDAIKTLVDGYGQGGEDNLAKRLADETTELYDYYDETTTTLKEFSFYKDYNLRKIELPNLTAMTNSFLNDISRQGYHFGYCENLEEVSFPNMTQFTSNRVFYGCRKLTKINMPKAESIQTQWSSSQGRAFAEVGADATSPFKLCFPYLQPTGDGYMFYNCGATVIAMPRIAYKTASNSIGGAWFNTLPNLKIVDIGYSNSISNNAAFASSPLLDTLILRKTSSVSSLSNVSAFTGTPFATDGTGGKIYVPSALINSYQTATNWATLYDAGTVEFVALEGSPYEDLDWADDFDLSTL